MITDKAITLASLCAFSMKNAEISHLISDQFSLMLYLVVRFEDRNDETENRFDKFRLHYDLGG
jgi:hypothetical protein